MNSTSIERIIKQVLVDILDLGISSDEITDEELLFPQGLDARTPIEIAQALEKAFGISIEDEALREERFESVCTLAEIMNHEQ